MVIDKEYYKMIFKRKSFRLVYVYIISFIQSSTKDTRKFE